MTKENVEKVTQNNTPLDVNDISADEKKNLAEFLSDKGFTISTFYLRFFQKGFDAWEIQGIKNCKKQFLAIPEVANLLSEYVETDALGNEIGKKGYLVEAAQTDEPGVFYTCLKKANNGLCMKFFAFMEERGMSRTTIIKRFTADDWKPWEQEGIKALLLLKVKK
nr:MAG TPA: hypothetical protein [Caudoviricetes sp.]